MRFLSKEKQRVGYLCTTKHEEERMRSSQLFAAITVALGAIFLGTCIYFREDLGIPTEVFTGLPKNAPGQTGPRCTPVVIQTNATASAITFHCRDFEDASKGEEEAEKTRHLVRVGQHGLNFTIETINPSIREMCAEYGTDIEICDPVDQVGAAAFIVWNTQERCTHRGVDNIRFYFTDKNNVRKDALLQFRYWRTTAIDKCTVTKKEKKEKACTLVREDVTRGFVIDRVWRLTRFDFEFILTITDSLLS
jgi:hypothetical protein